LIGLLMVMVVVGGGGCDDDVMNRGSNEPGLETLPCLTSPHVGLCALAWFGWTKSKAGWLPW
jgi:hypothetical protein